MNLSSSHFSLLYHSKNQRMSVESHLVFIPFPLMSHLISAVQTAKLLIEHDESLSITVLVLMPLADTKIDYSIKNSLDSRINFIEITENPELVLELSKSPKTSVHRLVEGQKDCVKDKVSELMENTERFRVSGLVLNMFCISMIDVANELGIPSFLFFASGAGVLGLFFDLQSLSDDHEDDFKKLLDDVESELSVQTYVSKIPARVLPSSLLNMEAAKVFLSLTRRFRETKGILINTFLELESHAVRAMMSDEEIPPVYPIGPIIHHHREQSAEKQGKQDEILQWLNIQPDSSVVYLCFGSKGYLERDQVKEIAMALEWSGQRFLWSLRKPPTKETMGFPGEYENLEEVLPEGFLERTTGTGKVLGWAPQLAILSHPATGGFVSHCGWNSILESILYGVPIATWPLAAEQQVNAFFFVKELGIAVEVQMDYRMNSGVVVGAQKIESAIRQLMDPRNDIRDKLKVMKNKSEMASTEGGSSYDHVVRFIEDIKQR